MAKYGTPEKFIAIVNSFHEGMLARVLGEVESSENFQVTNGIKHSCVVVPHSSVWFSLPC